MLPVYLSKVLAFVANSDYTVVPHFSNIEILRENLSETLKVDPAELEFFNINTNLALFEPLKLEQNEIFVDESIFSEIKNLDNDSFIYFDSYYKNLLQNLEIAGPASFLAIQDPKLLYEIGYSYFSNLFKEKALTGSIYITGLTNKLFSDEQIISLITDAYSGEGLVKIYTSKVIGQQSKADAKLLADVFFGAGKTEIDVDFGIDEEHKINMTKADRIRVNLGGKPTKVNVKTPARIYSFDAEEGELGFFIDLRLKPMKSNNLLEDKISLLK